MYRYGGYGIVFRMLKDVAEAYNYAKKEWVKSEAAFEAFVGERDSYPITRKEAQDIIALYTPKYSK